MLELIYVVSPINKKIKGHYYDYNVFFLPLYFCYAIEFDLIHDDFYRVQQYSYQGGGFAVVIVPGLCICIYLKAIKKLNGKFL